MDSIGNRIKELRKDSKLTQEQFGKKIGLKDSSVSMIERNERHVTESVIKNIMAEFCVNEAWLKEGTGEKYNQELLLKKNFLDSNQNHISFFLQDRLQSMLNKIYALDHAEQKDLLTTLETIFSIFSFPEIIKENESTDEYNSNLHRITQDEKNLLENYRKLDNKEKNEVLTFITFKIYNNSVHKIKNSILSGSQNEDAASI